MSRVTQEVTLPVDFQSLCWYDDVSEGWWLVGYGFEVYLYSVGDNEYQADHILRNNRQLDAVLSVCGGVSSEVMETLIVNELLQRPWLWEGC